MNDIVSEDFELLVCDGGSPVVTCGFCHRTNFDLNGEFMGDGELEELLNKQSISPELYHGQNNTISHGYINGYLFVAGCPCNLASKYEKFIWNNRHFILKYLKRKITFEHKNITSDKELIEELC